jgi:hypothetical protein
MRHKDEMPMQTSLAMSTNLAFPEQHVRAESSTIRSLQKAAEAPPRDGIGLDGRK